MNGSFVDLHLLLLLLPRYSNRTLAKGFLWFPPRAEFRARASGAKSSDFEGSEWQQEELLDPLQPGARARVEVGIGFGFGGVGGWWVGRGGGLGVGWG